MVSQRWVFRSFLGLSWACTVQDMHVSSQIARTMSELSRGSRELLFPFFLLSFWLAYCLLQLLSNVSSSHNVSIIVLIGLLHWCSPESGQIQTALQTGCSKNHQTVLGKRLWKFHSHFALSTGCQDIGFHYRGGLFFKVNVVLESRGWNLGMLKLHKAPSYGDSAIFLE